jgi:uncharacterized protein (UPF0276 family)
MSAPARSGIGLRQPHSTALLAAPPPLGFVEVHAENYFGAGGAALAVLEAARERWPLSLHGVGLGLGSAIGLDTAHLQQLVALVRRFEPVLVSEHACFARAPRRAGGPVVHGNDLLPIAFNEAALAILAANVQQAQDALRWPLLIENLSAYVHWADDTLAEPEFFNELARRTGCGLLLDVNNLVVNALNQGLDEAGATAAACRWVDAITPGTVGEIHLAGYAVAEGIVIDDHGSRVHAPVWQVYRHTLQRLGWRPTLVEWDTELPALPVLLAEARAADVVWAEVGAEQGAAATTARAA